MLLLPYRPIVASLPPDNADAYAPLDGNGPSVGQVSPGI